MIAVNHQASQTQKQNNMGIQDKYQPRKWTKQDKNINKRGILERKKGHFVNNMQFLIQATYRGKFTFKNYVSQNS